MKQESKDCLTCSGCLVLLLLVCVISSIAMTMYALRPSAENTVYHVAPGPGGAWKAVVFERNAGATTGFSTQVSVLNADEDLPAEPGNVLGMDGHPDHTKVQVEWLDSDTLRVSYVRGYADNHRHKSKRVGHIRILFVARELESP